MNEKLKPVREISRQAFSALRKGRSRFPLEMSDISHDSEYMQLFTHPDSPEGFVLRREPSGDAWVLFDAEVAREGFPGKSREWFLEFFSEIHQNTVSENSLVWRVEFEWCDVDLWDAFVEGKE